MQCNYPNCGTTIQDGRRRFCPTHRDLPAAAKPGPLKTPCHIFLGATNHTGYGRINRNGLNQYAHRYAWTKFNGEPPTGALVLHRCDVRKCCNVDHLYLGTHRQNAEDMFSRGRHPGHTRKNAQWKISVFRHAPQDDLVKMLEHLSSTGYDIAWLRRNIH